MKDDHRPQKYAESGHARSGQQVSEIAGNNRLYNPQGINCAVSFAFFEVLLCDSHRICNVRKA